MSSSLPCQMYQKIVRFDSWFWTLSIELIRSAGLFINVVRPANVSSDKLLPVIFVSVQTSKRPTELRQSPSVYIWRSLSYPFLSLRTVSDPGFSGAFQVGDTSQYIGDNIVHRSIALDEPVIYVSANYRLNGMETLNDPVRDHCWYSSSIRIPRWKGSERSWNWKRRPLRSWAIQYILPWLSLIFLTHQNGSPSTGYKSTSLRLEVMPGRSQCEIQHYLLTGFGA